MSDPLPVSDDIEQCLLCDIALSPEIMDQAEIGQKIFFSPAHKLFYAHLAQCYTDNGTCEWSTFWHSFSFKDAVDCGGKENISAIYGKLPTSADWRHHLDIVRQYHVQRTTILACQRLILKMQEPLRDSAAICREIAEKALTAIATGTNDNGEVYLSDLIRDDHFKTKQAGSAGHLEPSNIRALNLALGWFVPGDQVVIGAETSYGKTTLALNMAMHAALKQNKKVAVFSFEMSQSDICKRLTSAGSAVPLKKIRYNETNDQEEGKIAAFYQSIPQKKRSIVIEEGYSFDIAEVVGRCRRLKATGDLDVVIVDYLQLVNPAVTRESNRQLEVADISRRLKVMAGELKVVVIALSQLNDDGKLRESRAIGQNADIVLFIEDSKSDDAFEKQIRIGKARNGPRDQRVKVDFLGDYVTFTDKGG